MSYRTEQRICLRFCFRLGKTATEAHEMLQKAFKEEALSRTKVFEWFAWFKRGEMSVEDHPHSGHPSTSRTDENVEKILTRSQKLQVWVGVPVSGFWPWIWTWDTLPRSLFPACSHRTKRTLVWLCARSWKIRVKVTQTFFLRSSWATKVGVMGTTLRPNKLRANGRCPLHRDRKKQDKWGQMWKRCSLFFSMFEESCPGNSFLLDSQSGILLGGFEVIERECAKKTPRIVEIGWLVSPSWQRPSSHSVLCDLVFGLSGMDRRSPPILFTGPSPLWFLFIPDNKKNIKRKEICHRGGGENSFAGGTQHQASAVPEMLHTVGKKRLDKCIASNGEYFVRD